MARPGLFAKSKFLRLARALGSEALAVGHLELMWHAAYENMSDTFKDAAEVEAAARWSGEPGALVALLVDARFLDKKRRGSTTKFLVHDFWEHAPEYTKKRLARSLKEKAELSRKIARVRTTAAERRTTAAVVQHSPPVPSPPLLPEENCTQRELPTSAIAEDAMAGGGSTRSDWEQLFEDGFWPAYPRKVAKAAAKKAWNSLRPKRPPEMQPVANGIANVLWLRMREDWAGRPKDKIPHPATFLRAEEFTPQADEEAS